MAYVTRNPNVIEPPDETFPYACPECGASLNEGDEVYVNDMGVFLGCCFCVDRKDAEDVFG